MSLRLSAEAHKPMLYSTGACDGARLFFSSPYRYARKAEHPSKKANPKQEVRKRCLAGENNACTRPHTNDHTYEKSDARRITYAAIVGIE